MLNHPAILERVIDPQRGDFPADLAQRVLMFTFAPQDRERYLELSARAQSDTLTADERGELGDYLNVNDFLMILKAKAHASLNSQTSAA
jgi:hypothetical protein